MSFQDELLLEFRFRENKRKMNLTNKNLQDIQEIKNNIKNKGISHILLSKSGLILFRGYVVISLSVSDSFKQKSLAYSAPPQERRKNAEPRYDFMNELLIYELCKLSIDDLNKMDIKNITLSDTQKYQFEIESVVKKQKILYINLIQSFLHGGITGSTHSNSPLQVCNYTRIMITLACKDLI